MKIIYDVETQILTIDDSTSKPWGADISALINRHGQIIVFNNLSFGVSVKADGVSILDKAFPPPGTKYSKTDQDLITTVRCFWNPDQAITVDAWIQNGGNTYYATHEFVAPRPVQPYPSWSWIDGKWEPPIAVPDASIDYIWSEEGREWLLP
jgi:hypothetical protein